MGPKNELQGTEEFYDAACSRYDAEVDSTENLQLRDHFRRRVSALAGAGGTILDFGCGTGKDASWYALHGHRTLAYDISSGMVDVLRRRCVQQIADGTVVAVAGGLNRLESELEKTGPVAAVAANFAVLNHISDLRPVFRVFASNVAPRGVVAASVLNPFYWPDMKCGWWWRSVIRSFGSGAIRFAGDVTTYRHFLSAMTKAAAPAFILAEQGSTWRASLDRNFLLLVLRKRD